MMISKHVLAFCLLLLSLTVSTYSRELDPDIDYCRTHLICHGDTCYPQLFEPTESFVAIKHDQLLPPGLFHRVKTETGLQEARLVERQSRTPSDISLSPYSTSWDDKLGPMSCVEEDCYPVAFQPTSEFQVIRRDQKLPAGLHVRMNLQTGLKEAKLYDRTGDNDNDTSLQAVEVVPDEDRQAVSFSGLAQAVLSSSADEPIRPPSTYATDAPIFNRATQQICYERAHGRISSPESRDELKLALADLEELSHDMYWGQQLTSKPPLLRALLQMFSTDGDGVGSEPEASTSEHPLRPLAARVLAAACNNNPPAVAATVNATGAEAAARLAFPWYSAEMQDLVAAEETPALLSLASALLQDDRVLQLFIQSLGLRRLAPPSWSPAVASGQTRLTPAQAALAQRIETKMAHLLHDHLTAAPAHARLHRLANTLRTETETDSHEDARGTQAPEQCALHDLHVIRGLGDGRFLAPSCTDDGWTPWPAPWAGEDCDWRGLAHKTTLAAIAGTACLDGLGLYARRQALCEGEWRQARAEAELEPEACRWPLKHPAPAVGWPWKWWAGDRRRHFGFP